MQHTKATYTLECALALSEGCQPLGECALKALFDGVTTGVRKRKENSED